MSILQNYGINLLIENKSILQDRKIGFIHNLESLCLENIDKFIKNLNLVDIEKYDIIATLKTHNQGFFMKWHVDDAQIIKHKKEIEFDNQIKLNQKHYLNYSEMVPEYTLIIYLSTYQVDFTGGTLQFSDDTIIDPQKGMYVFFNSKEPHRLNIIRSGIRSNYLIKFYPKISK